VAIDPFGNLLIADQGAPAIYRFNSSGARTTVSTSVADPSVLVTDAAGNLLVADAADILAVPASSNSASFTAASLAPSALAIDAAGNLYTGFNGGVLKLTRTQGYVQFAASTAPQTVSMLDSGNRALTLSSLGQTDTADFSLSAASSTDCTLSGSVPSAVAIGGACAMNVSYTPATFLTRTDTGTLDGNPQNAALSTPSSIQLVLTGPTAAPATSIALGAFVPAAPAYGQSVTASATVSGASVAPTGTVVFTLDGTTTFNETVNSNGVATALMTGLSTGQHAVTAAYASTNGYASSTTSSSSSFTVGTATPTIGLTSSMNPAMLQNSVTFTATISSAVGTPTGTVNFLNGTTLLGWGTLTAGAATYSTSSLAVGSDPITAVYLGDANFSTVTSTIVTQSIIDISFGTPIAIGGTGTTETVQPGGTATYELPIAPSSGSSFPVALTLTVSGLPTGTTESVTPSSWVQATNSSWTLPPNTTLSGYTVLSIVVPQNLSAVQPASGNLSRRVAPFMLALLLLPFAGRMLRAGKRLGRTISVLLLLAASMVAVAGLNGCDIHRSKSYTVTITAAGGGQSASSAVTLIVQ
jgi:hypothetical protein